MADAPQSIPEILNAAADLLTPEGAWTQNNLGRDKNGGVVRDAMNIKSAVCFCMAGAIWKAASRNGEVMSKVCEVVSKAFDVVQPVVGVSGIGPWNDAPGRTQAEVVAALRAAAVSA